MIAFFIYYHRGKCMFPVATFHPKKVTFFRLIIYKFYHYLQEHIGKLYRKTTYLGLFGIRDGGFLIVV